MPCRLIFSSVKSRGHSISRDCRSLISHKGRSPQCFFLFEREDKPTFGSRCTGSIHSKTSFRTLAFFSFPWKPRHPPYACATGHFRFCNVLFIPGFDKRIHTSQFHTKWKFSNFGSVEDMIVCVPMLRTATPLDTCFVSDFLFGTPTPRRPA